MSAGGTVRGVGEPLELADWLLCALAEACRRDRTEISLQTSLWDLALDSLSLVSITTLAETIYGIELEVDDVEAMLRGARVADILAVLERRMVRQVRMEE